jgi:hypothetical protein
MSRSLLSFVLTAGIFAASALGGCAVPSDVPSSDDDGAIPDDLRAEAAAWQSVAAPLPASSLAARLGAKDVALLYDVRPAQPRWSIVFLLRGPANAEWMRIAYSVDLRAGGTTRDLRRALQNFKVTYTPAGFARLRSANAIPGARTVALIGEAHDTVRAAFSAKIGSWPSDRPIGPAPRALGDRRCSPSEAAVFPTPCADRLASCGVATAGALSPACGIVTAGACARSATNMTLEMAECQSRPVK